MCILVLEDRRAHPIEKKDLLNVMLNGRDKETGLSLPEQNIKQNVCFLDLLIDRMDC